MRILDTADPDHGELISNTAVFGVRAGFEVRFQQPGKEWG